MIIRVVGGRARAGKIDEVKEVIERISIPWQKSQKGVLDYYPGVDLHIDEFIMVSLWEDLACLKAVGGEFWNRPIVPAEELPLLERVHVQHYEVFGLK